jgi:integrase
MPPLTDAAIRRAKPAEKTVRMHDAGGLYLEILPAGGRYWRMKYRRPGSGKENRLALGVYPTVTLADARARRDEARRLLASGVDPGAQRKATAAASGSAEGDSFDVVAREWLASRLWVAGYLEKVTAWMKNDVFPWVGARAARDLSAPDFLAVARRVEARGAIESAHRIMQNCGQVMRYAIATGRADRNPCADLKGALKPSPEKHHAAITEADDLGPLLRAIDGYRGTHAVRCALQLAPLVFLRPVELRTAEWAEFDIAASRWNIPAEKMKTRQPHVVPLSRQALAILAELEPVTGSGRYLFPCQRSPKRPMSENTVNGALRRMGFDRDTMTGHGFRATARTILDEVLHVRPDFIEHQLAHAVRDPNGRAYNRTKHLKERAVMMQSWADYLDKLRVGGKVIDLGAARRHRSG